MPGPKREYGEKQITPRARIAFPFLFNPDTRQDQKPKFRCTLIFDPSDAQVKEGLKAMKQECLDIAQKAFGKTEGVKLPFRNGDEKSQYDGFAGNIFISASTSRRPAVVGPNPKQAAMETDIYGGCYVRASLVPATYSMGGQPGVSFYLQNVQKLEEGEVFGGGSSNPEDDFGAVASPDNETLMDMLSSQDEEDTLGL